jgi:hypothetical protein
VDIFSLYFLFSASLSSEDLVWWSQSKVKSPLHVGIFGPLHHFILELCLFYQLAISTDQFRSTLILRHQSESNGDMPSLDDILRTLESLPKKYQR